VDISFGLPQDMSQEEPLSLSADPENPLEIPVEAVANLTYSELVDIWRVDLFLPSLSAAVDIASITLRSPPLPPPPSSFHPLPTSATLTTLSCSDVLHELVWGGGGGGGHNLKPSIS